MCLQLARLRRPLQNKSNKKKKDHMVSTSIWLRVLHCLGGGAGRREAWKGPSACMITRVTSCDTSCPPVCGHPTQHSRDSVSRRPSYASAPGQIACFETKMVDASAMENLGVFIHVRCRSMVSHLALVTVSPRASSRLRLRRRVCRYRQILRSYACEWASQGC